MIFVKKAISIMAPWCAIILTFFCARKTGHDFRYSCVASERNAVMIVFRTTQFDTMEETV